jgi:hypothetical protein
VPADDIDEPTVIARPAATLFLSKHAPPAHHGVLNKSTGITLYAEPGLPLVDVTASANINAMEKSKYSPQAIQTHHDDHVGRGSRARAMTTSADTEEAWQAEGRGERGAASNTSCKSPSSVSGYQGQKRSVRRRCHRSSFSQLGYLLVLIASLWIVPASAVLIDFDNCLSESVQKSTPLQLQFVPLYAAAVFNTTDSAHNLRVTVWGNVTGSGPTVQVVLPPPPPLDDGYWASNQTARGGKIMDIPYPTLTDPKLTTLFNKVDVLTYEPFANSVDFCSQLVNASCPLAPIFNNA